MKVCSLVYIPVCGASVIFTLLTSFQLCLFLSSNQSGLLKVRPAAKWSVESNKLADYGGGTWLNVAFLVIFIASHSLMATQQCKCLLESAGLSPIYRSMYNIVTSLSLQLLMQYWRITSHLAPLWNFTDYHLIILLCQILHVIGWLSIFSTVYILDFNEFIGLKQVQFHVNHLGCPMLKKTIEAQSFFRNMRHPVVTGVMLVLWAVPCMSVDRFLLASGLSLYLFLGGNTNNDDYKYVARMYDKKSHSLDDSCCQ